MRKQNGSITNVVLIVLFALCALAWIYVDSPAKPEDVQALVQKAKTSAVATAIIQANLKDHPTPTISELNVISGKVDEQLTLEISKSVTGDALLQSTTATQDAGNKKGVEQLSETMSSPIIDYGLEGLLVILLIGILIIVFRKTHN